MALPPAANLQACAFCNQFNWLPIYAELAPANKASAATVIHASAAVVCTFYVVFGTVCLAMGREVIFLQAALSHSGGFTGLKSRATCTK